MIVCPECEYDKNPDGSKKCEGCGKSFENLASNQNPGLSLNTEQTKPTITTLETMGETFVSPAEQISNKSNKENEMITCTVCGYDKNPDGSEYCDACGSELENVAPTPESTEETFVPEPSTPQPIPPITQSATTIAKLIAQQSNAPVPEFSLEGNALIGIFDPETGPVDIDLEEFSGNETVSRNHAEIYQEAGVWKIKDLGSTNGVFIKSLGQTRFGARITTPESLNSGDEIAIAKIKFLFQSS